MRLNNIASPDYKLLLCLLPLPALLILVFPGWIVDDAYIIFRYAKNLYDFGEFTYNVGQNPVEGYTGVLLPVLIYIGFFVGVEPVLLSHIIGIAALQISIFVLWNIFSELKFAVITRFVFTAIYLLTPILYTHTLSGLETILFSLSLLLCVLFFLKSFEHTLYFTHFLISCLITSLIRPEGVLVSVILSITLLYNYRGDKKTVLKLILRLFFFYVIPGFLYFLWRFNYYGEFLPNTFYVKSFLVTRYRANLENLFSYIQNYLLIPFTFSTLLFFLFKAVLNRHKGKNNKNEQTAFSLLIIILLCHLFYYFSTLEMNYSFRFYFPYYIFLLILFGMLADKGMAVLLNKKVAGTVYNIYLLLAIIFTFLQLAVIAINFKNELLFTERYERLLENQHYKAAEFIREQIHANGKLLVHIDAGAIPYLTGMQTLDFRGLNDEKLATGNLTECQVNDYFFEYDADVLSMTSSSPKNYKGTAVSIVNDPRFSNYMLVKIFSAPGINDYHQFVYIKGKKH